MGNLVQIAEDKVLQWMIGPCLPIREAVSRQMVELRSQLLSTAQSELEKLLIDRIVISWVEVYTADAFFVERLGKDTSIGSSTLAAQKVLDRAQQRYLNAIRTLATVQKLARPAPSPIEIATRMGGVAAQAARRQTRPVCAGVGVEN
jgi:hypothetical protein